MARSDVPPRVSSHLDAASSRWLGEFVRCHRRQLTHGIARHFGLRPQDQDEVLSDTLLGLCRVQHKLDPTKSPFTLAYTIALRKARTKLKQVAALRLREERVLSAGNLPDNRPSSESYVVAEERRASVRRFIDGLPSTDRRIVEARHIDGLTWDQISARVRLPKTSVVRRYRAIIAEARRALATWDC
jgi:RNA polymerase sigma factor (sigma-70 family)